MEETCCLEKHHVAGDAGWLVYVVPKVGCARTVMVQRHGQETCAVLGVMLEPKIHPREASASL